MLNIFSPILVLITVFFLASAAYAKPEKTRVGWVEKVSLEPEGIQLHAKLDTGADSSSMSATYLEEFEKNGDPWVRFTLSNRYGKSASYERPIIRNAYIKRHLKKAQRRPVVRLGICIADKYMESDFSLADRSNFNYELLLGRVFLAGYFLIDPSSQYLTSIECNVSKDDSASSQGLKEEKPKKSSKISKTSETKDK
ncbi:MAG: RimK/LysX family protein [Bdellovibrionota bacterium]